MSNLKMRHVKEKLFKVFGLLAISTSLLFLAILLIGIAYKGYGALWSTNIKLPVLLDSKRIANDESFLKEASLNRLIEQSLKELFPEVTGDDELFKLLDFISIDATDVIYGHINNNPELLNKTIEIWLPASDNLDLFMKKDEDYTSDDKQYIQMQKLKKQGRLRRNFTLDFLFNTDSREPEKAGIASSLIGTIFAMAVCILFSFPIAVFGAIYLEELAPKNKLTTFIEVNINNLASVPSIVFGLIGLAILSGFFELPRSSSLIAGITLGLMAIPTITISTRAAIRTIPSSIREAVMAVGASKMQLIWHHILPMAAPGIMTGMILSIARAIGETAPLILIGMVAFIVDIPGSFLDPATVIPVQIYLWSDSPEQAFVEKTCAAIILLLLILALINLTAVYIRKKYGQRW
jgi:phosphate transport system permease protein